MAKDENGVGIEDVAESLEDLLDFSVTDTKEKKRGAVVKAEKASARVSHEEEFIAISVQDAQKILQISGLVAQGSGKDDRAKTVGMQVNGDELVIMLTDFEIYVKRAVSLLNDKPKEALSDFIAIKSDILSKFLRVCNENLIIYKKSVTEPKLDDDLNETGEFEENVKYYIVLEGGDMEIETLPSVKMEDMLLEEDSSDALCETNKADFLSKVSYLFSLASASPNISERRIFFKKGKASAMFITSMVECEIKGVPDNIDLKLKDSRILYVLASLCSSDKISFYNQEDRMIIKGNNYMYSYLVSDYSVPAEMEETLEQVLKSDCNSVSLSHLSGLTGLARDLPYSTGDMLFNFDKSGSVSLVIVTKKDNSTLVLNGVLNKNSKPLPKAVSLQAFMLAVVLSCFSGDENLELYLSPNGIGFRNSDFKGMLGISDDM